MSAQFKVNGLTIGQDEVDIMRRITVVVFEVLEKAWATRDCTLIDMKIEFGVDSRGTLLPFASDVSYVCLFIQCDKCILYNWCWMGNFCDKSYIFCSLSPHTGVCQDRLIK